MNYDFDLICLGGGSGGIACANKAAELGAKVALIEENKLGGTCVNLGCIPKKIMWTAAELLHKSKQDLAAYSITTQDIQLNWSGLVAKRKAYITKLNSLYAAKLNQNKVIYIEGFGQFKDKHTLTVNNKSYSAKHIVVATGGKPLIPNVSGAELGISSDGFFALTELPQHIAIIGSGYIGVELACMLNHFGVTVDLIVRGTRVLSHFDETISAILMELMQHQGIRFHYQEQVTGLIQKNKKINLRGTSDKEHLITTVDSAIWAIGRKANTHQLNTSAIGLALNEKGEIIADQWQNTNIKNIYAIGDVTGGMQLTPVAIAAGRKLATRLFGDDPNSHLDYGLIPTVIFTHPPVATIGLSEKDAIEKYGKRHIKIYQSRFIPLYYALHDNNKIPVYMKLITLGDQEKIIGCHLIGLHTDEILQGFAVAIKMGATKKDFDDTLAIHPTIAEELVTLR